MCGARYWGLMKVRAQAFIAGIMVNLKMAAMNCRIPKLATILLNYDFFEIWYFGDYEYDNKRYRKC